MKFELPGSFSAMRPYAKKIVFASFLVFAGAIVAEILNNFFGFDGSILPPVLFETVLPFVFVSLYLCWNLGYRRGIMILVISMSVASAAEMFLLSFGNELDWGYGYGMEGPEIFGLPVFISIGWATLIGLGYAVVNVIIQLSGMKKPGVKEGLVFLFMVVLLDAFVVTSIDMVLDPIKVLEGSWVWFDGGPYYDVLLKNFIGWMGAVAISTGIFRLVEYRSPEKSRNDLKVLWMPVAAYFLISFYLISEAVSFGLPDLALIGIFATMPISVLVMVLLFSSYRRL